MVFRGSILKVQNLIPGFHQDGLEGGQGISPARIPSTVLSSVFLGNGGRNLGFNRGVDKHV